MSAARDFSSSEKSETRTDAARDFFELIMRGEFADISEERLAVLEDTRGNLEEALTYDFPARQEPKSIDRTPTEHLEMVTWERTPLAAA